MAASEDSSSNSPPPAEGPSPLGAPGAVDPSALTIEQLARVLGVPAKKLREHVEAGAPTSADGTINLVHYAAWLNRELARPEPVEGTRTDGD